MTSKEIQDYVFTFLKNKGMNTRTICSIMGNITAESEWNPDSIESGNGIGFGLCQWSYGRRTQLEAYGTSLEHQCNFLYAELTGIGCSSIGCDPQWIANVSSKVTGYEGYSYTLEKFLSGDDSIRNLTEAFMFCWERPAPETNHFEWRLNAALEFYEIYKDVTEPEEPEEPEPEEPEPEEPEPEEPEPSLYDLLLETSYNINQLNSSKVDFMKTLKLGDSVQLIYINQTSRNKKKYGVDKYGNKLTIDTKTYIIDSVFSNGFLKLMFNENYICKVNPILIKEGNNES